MDATPAIPLTTRTRDRFAITYRNGHEFDLIYREIFRSGIYDFACDRPAPVIIDAGAHIGLASLFFKRRYPRARLVAIEPNPATFAILERNITQNCLADVQLVQAALAATPGSTPFFVGHDATNPWTWGDAAVRNAWFSQASTREIVVPATPLSRFLDQPVDLLKLDVEGLETAVLTEALPRLHQVRQIILEFHGSVANPTNRLDDILAMLGGSGFAYLVSQRGHIIDESRLRAIDPYWLLIRANRPARFLDSFIRERPHLHRLHGRVTALTRAINFGFVRPVCRWP